MHLQRTFAEAESEYLGNVLLHLGFEDDILAGDPEVDVTLAYEGGDVGCREEDTGKVSETRTQGAGVEMDEQCDIVVLHQTYI